jgi:hypothetical protein
MQLRTSGGAGGQPHPAHSPGRLEMILVWSVTGIMSAAVFITYARLPVSEFYNVSIDGLAGGASRALTYLNYPVAFIAIAMIGFALAHLYSMWSTISSASKVALGTLTLVALGTSLIAAIPGVVNQSDLDARLVNAIPAVGVFLAAVLTVIALRLSASTESTPWGGFDRFRAGISIILFILSLPWIFAYIGFYIGSIPILGNLFMSQQMIAGETLAAVHLGAHHGMDGVLFFLAGLWLTRELFRIRPEWLRWSLSAYLSLMVVYGLTIAAQDFWLEQVVKRGWTTVEIPNAVVPALTPIWGFIGVAVLILTIVLIRTSEPAPSPEAPGRRDTWLPWSGRMQRIS